MRTLGIIGLGKMGRGIVARLRERGYEIGDRIGRGGLEASYESELRGTPGAHRQEVDAHGVVRADLGSTPPCPVAT